MKKNRLNLLWKILIPTISLVAVIVIILSSTSYIMSKKALEHQINEEMKVRVIALTDRINDWVTNILSDLRLMSQDKRIAEALEEDNLGTDNDPPAWERLSKRLHELSKMYPVIHVIALVNADGEIIAGSEKNIIGKINITDRDYFQESINGRPFVSGIIQSRANEDTVFIISIPVSGRKGEKGIFFIAVKMETFMQTIIDPVKISNSGYAYIIDNKGICVAHPDRPTIGADISRDNFGQFMLEQRKGFVVYKWKGIPKFCAFNEYKRQGWIIIITAPMNEVFQDIGLLKIYMGIIALAGLLLFGFGITLLIKKIVIKPLDILTDDLTAVSEKVNLAAQQIAMSGKTVSEGTADQAASIEETSSSLEEVTAMTRKNADNAGSAKKLAQKSMQSFKSANQAMTLLTSSMQDIAQSSSETQKIIKSIDEIAFQTNLLALNAAVEAARAGESGAGFAVVAGEVRSLAMKAAKASGNTSNLIEETVKKIKAGSHSLKQANQAFESASEYAEKVSGLIDEISSGSMEQAQGISQINNAAADMDKVVQQNAAIAEESASGSQEMSSQAEKLRNMIVQLKTIMG
ncbi:Methyl-accepting chemotaxis receptor protein [Desulfonema limicola]|uniref:Methyl-accepting chemotaxis receptor protein n=1 Tax=Desulfonema limicola TaxID=45656 RepID=A0A975B6R0_9BACT|nr:methyl-accepting chemotaxis protein [Desulfonema limicola]QTA79864.1 Methyl-accepting chemotaxis receptor protein [Desulfonema limicola]